MSTEHITIQDSIDKTVTLEFATGSGGYRLTIEWKRPHFPLLLKFWFTPKTWEELKTMVDFVIASDEGDNKK